MCHKNSVLEKHCPFTVNFTQRPKLWQAVQGIFSNVLKVDVKSSVQLGLTVATSVVDSATQLIKSISGQNVCEHVRNLFHAVIIARKSVGNAKCVVSPAQRLLLRRSSTVDMMFQWSVIRIHPKSYAELKFLRNYLVVTSVKSHATWMCKELYVENLVVLYSTVVITALVSVDVVTKVVCISAAGQSVGVSKLVDTYVISHALQTAHHAWRNATTTVCIADVIANATNVVCLVQSHASGTVSI